MVRQGDFQISLVHADSRKPFKEHFSDGKVYVEAEPDAEYFISIQRISDTFPGPLIAVISVDGHQLPYSLAYKAASPYAETVGLYTNQNGFQTDTALKFTKPRRAARNDRQYGNPQQSGLLMGKVQVAVYQGFFCGYTMPVNSHMSWNEPAMDTNGAGSFMANKSLRSGEGSSSFTSQRSGPIEKYTPGARVDVVTLNYCAALGLMQLGVLPKPPPGAYQRMLKAYTSPGTSGTASPTKVPTVTPIRIKSFLGRVDELYDLTHLDDDDDDE